MPLYLYPFLNTNSKNRPFEYLRLTSLGVIGALVKVRLTATSGGPVPTSSVSHVPCAVRVPSHLAH